ncbi:hypothetical protein LR48_Vigan08g029500 [Vigna angularis]|uniref:Uncharacterized protein n=1 Tax=Phaseolus angularis TaxID=3914 RepID=A0A0L9V377_PHAAN|nr:hypothetical protein LR48_Vigan08g029500 [Vigna angularis]
MTVKFWLNWLTVCHITFPFIQNDPCFLHLHTEDSLPPLFISIILRTLFIAGPSPLPPSPLLNHLVFEQKLDESAMYEQKGMLWLPCRVLDFECVNFLSKELS